MNTFMQQQSCTWRCAEIFTRHSLFGTPAHNYVQHRATLDGKGVEGSCPGYQREERRGWLREGEGRGGDG